MRFIKLAIISFVVFFVLLYLMSLLIPSHVRISRAININADISEIRPLLADSSRWNQWMDMNTSGIEVILLPSDSSIIPAKWNYKERTINSTFRLEESAGITVVQWYFDFYLKWYPWEKFGSITFDKQFGIPMESSLNKLKNLLEKSP